MNTRRYVLCCEGGRPLKEAAQGGCGGPILGDAQNPTDTVLGSLLQGPCSSRGLDNSSQEGPSNPSESVKLLSFYITWCSTK